MKISKLSLAVAAAILSSNVSALNLLGADVPSLRINISGASASDKGLADLATDLCVGGTLQTFTDRCADETAENTLPGGNITTCALSGPKLPGKSYTAFFCSMNNASAGIVGTEKVLIRKRSEGGSFWGTAPVAAAQTDVQQMVLNNANCKPTLANPSIIKCNKANTQNTVSDAGIADAEPELFVSPNVGVGELPMTPSLAANLNSGVIAALTFGIPVTNPLYAALQKAQGLNADLDGDSIEEGTSENASEADILANMPSLSTLQVGALFKGSIASWNNVFFGGVALPSVAGVTAPANPIVAVCRRVNGSGTQAQLNANFLNVPCSKSADLPASDTTTCTGVKGQANPAFPFCPTGGAYQGYATLAGVLPGKAMIHENSGSGDVDECLDQLADANFWAVGVQSMEKASDNYSFIKIDGVEPTLAQVAAGNYHDWAATSFQWRKVVVNGQPVPAGNKLTVLQTLRTNLADPADLDALNDAVDQGFGATGWLSRASTSSSNRPFNENLPVMQYTRNGKTCNAQRAAFGAVDFDI